MTTVTSRGQREEVCQATVLAVGEGPDRWTEIGAWVEQAGFEMEVLGTTHDALWRIEQIDVGIVLADAAVAGLYALIASMHMTPASPPVIVLAETFEFDAVVQAFRSGAVDMLQLPLLRQALIERLVEAAQDDFHRARHRKLYRRLTRLIGSLTPRERQVMQCVVEGSANKQIAADLGISEKTVEVHRYKVMRKMEADSLAALVRMNMVIEAAAGRDAGELNLTMSKR
jgi:two-component system, LuxR family, response regulator FixJ